MVLGMVIQMEVKMKLIIVEAGNAGPFLPSLTVREFRD